MGACMVFVVARGHRLPGRHDADWEKANNRTTAEQVEGRLKNPNGMAAAHALVSPDRQREGNIGTLLMALE
jgi:hypothetical protein